MGEDMTYATEPTRAQLAARVTELERENAELRARLDAVPVDWNKAPDWAQWAAIDSNGAQCVYETEPHTAQWVWRATSDNWRVIAENIDMTYIDWTQTLQERPQAVKP